MDLMCQGCICESPAKGSGTPLPRVSLTPAHQHHLNIASHRVSLTPAHQHHLNTASQSVCLTPTH